MMLKTLIIEQLEIDGTLRTFTMDASRNRERITVALPYEFVEPRHGPLHFLDPRDEARYRDGFPQCRSRKLGPDYFARSGSQLSVRSLEWFGIPTEREYLSYYVLSFPKYAIPINLSVSDPRKAGREYRREITRDDQRNRYTVFLECSSSYGTFDFQLACELNVDKSSFATSQYSDKKTQKGYHTGDDYKHLLPHEEAKKVQQFFAEEIHFGPKYAPSVDQSTHIKAPITNSAFAAHSPQATQTVSTNPDLSSLLNRILIQAEADEKITKTELIIVQKEVTALKEELNQARPQQTVVERILGNLGSIASLTSLVNQIAPFLPALF